MLNALINEESYSFYKKQALRVNEFYNNYNGNSGNYYNIFYNRCKMENVLPLITGDILIPTLFQSGLSET